MTVTTQLHILAAMETARTEVADRAMDYWASIRDYPGSEWHMENHRRLMRSCETYAAARELLIDV